jgi:hypothetical protein
MLTLTGKELAAVPGQHMDEPCLELLCTACQGRVAWVSLRELAWVAMSSYPCLCFDCEESDSDSPRSKEAVQLLLIR